MAHACLCPSWATSTITPQHLQSSPLHPVIIAAGVADLAAGAAAGQGTAHLGEQTCAEVRAGRCRGAQGQAKAQGPTCGRCQPAGLEP